MVVGHWTKHVSTLALTPKWSTVSNPKASHISPLE